MEHTKIIALFGGYKALSQALGHKNPTTCQYWSEQGVIPRWRQHEVLAAAKKKRLGLTQESFEARK